MSKTNFLKEKLYNIWKYIKNPAKLILKICIYDNYRFAPLIPDKLFLKCYFRLHMNEKLNLRHPKTFNEKMQWLKLYDRKPQYSVMVDKAAVKNYIAEKIGEKYLIPTIGVYKNTDEIPFDELPQKFVIKCTHDSGSVFLCDKEKGIDTEKLKAEITKKLNIPFYYCGREWPYKNVTPQIIIEEFISDENGNHPVDYKFFCFDGKMEIFKIDYNRFVNHSSNYYNKNCEYLNIGEINNPPDPSIKLILPDNFNEMIALAEKLSNKMPFVRVDLYTTNNQIYFGELTFFPANGIGRFIGNGDVILGNLLQLPSKK